MAGAAERLHEARRVYNTVAGRVSRHRVFQMLKRITLHHRIQGSHGIVEAVEELLAYLVDRAPDTLEVDYYAYTGSKTPDWMRVNAAWNIHDAIVEGPGWRLRLEDHPTLAAAHTPPSEGWVEGEVVTPRGDPLEPSSYEGLGDKIVLITSYHRIAYRLAAEAGVSAVILAGPSRYSRAAPYYGLFLSPEEASRYTTVAVTLPWSLASNLEGKRVRLRVDADLASEPGRVPVLVAWIGDRSRPGPTLYAHICHPAPGANDNASGAASAVEAMLALAEAVEEGALQEPDETVRLILAPEYTGSLLALEGWLASHSTVAVNLDMVGRASPHSGSHRITYTPITFGPSRVGDTLYDIALTATGTRVDYYMAGSDHDAFLAYGVDAAMLNQWPDPYYHTSMDDVDTIDPDRLAKAASEAAAAAALLASGYEPTEAARRALLDKMLARASAEREWASMAQAILGLRLGLPQPGGGGEWRPVEDDRSIEPVAPIPVPPLTPVRDGVHGEARLVKRLSTLNEYYQVAMREAYYAGANGYTVRRLHAELAAVYGPRRVPGNTLVEALEALEEAGLLKLKG